jgi:hypothetical protein
VVYTEKELVPMLEIFSPLRGVDRLSDITDKIIPLFKKYPIEGVKAKDFADFCEVAELMKNKAHITEVGL